MCHTLTTTTTIKYKDNKECEMRNENSKLMRVKGTAYLNRGHTYKYGSVRRRARGMGCVVVHGRIWSYLFNIVTLIEILNQRGRVV